jgi:imidazolonepropionase-like amidohydrolase
MGYRPIVLIGGVLIDGTGREPLKNSVIVVEGNKIRDVGQEGDVKIPKDAEVIDIYNMTIMPGLIDTHIHICMDGEPKGLIERTVNQNCMFALVKGVSYLSRTLRRGITTAQDGGSGFNWMEVALRDGVNVGLIEGPRYGAAGYHITVTSGHGYFFPPWLGSRYGGDIIEQAAMHADGPEEWRKAVRLNLWYGVDMVKLVVSRDVISPGIPILAQASFEEVKAAVEEAHRNRRKVMAHANGPEAIRTALEAGVDIIVHGYFMDDDLIEMIVEKEAYLEPTNRYIKLLVEKGEGEQPDYTVEGAKEFWKDRVKNFKKYIDKGVKIVLGSDAGGVPYFKHGENARELEVMVELGIPPMQAIVSATKLAAECLGLQDKIGTIKPGKLADILVIDGNPLQDIGVLSQEEKLKIIMKDGNIIVRKL